MPARTLIACGGDLSGFSLVEVLVALAIFLIACLGALTVLGATATGGLQDASPTALTTARRARDLTVGAIYLQALHDHLAGQVDSTWDAFFSGWPPGTAEQTYCVAPGGTACDGLTPVLPGSLGAYPHPESTPYQLSRATVRITIQRRSWNCAATRYVLTAPPARDAIVLVQTAITWRWKDGVRGLVPARGTVRFMPYRSSTAGLAGETCS